MEKPSGIGERFRQQWFICRSTQRRSLKNPQQSHTMKNASVHWGICYTWECHSFTRVNSFCPSPLLSSASPILKEPEAEGRVEKEGWKRKVKNSEDMDTPSLLYPRPELGEGKNFELETFEVVIFKNGTELRNTSNRKVTRKSMESTWAMASDRDSGFSRAQLEGSNREKDSCLHPKNLCAEIDQQLAIIEDSGKIKMEYKHGNNL